MADRISQEVLEVALDSSTASNSRISQEVLEVVLCNPSTVRISQAIIEVILCSSAPSLSIACPISAQIATVGVLFTSNPPVIIGDHPPDTFVLLSGPSWMTINSTTGVVSGIPISTGTVSYSIQVTDSTAQVATASCTLFVSPTPAKAPTRCPLNFDQADDISLSCPILGSPAVIGVPYSKQMVVTGGLAPFSFLVTIGVLPTGLSLDGSTGFITGTPTATGTFNFTMQVIDSNAASDFVSCSITIIGSSILSVTCPLSGTANLGVAYSGTLTGSGGTPAYTFSIVSGALPTGLSLTGAVISGTPTALGTFNYTVRVTDSLGATADSPCQIIVSAPLPPPPPSNAPVITTINIPGGTVGFFYSFQLSATGTLPITWTATGVPSWMQVGHSGLITAIPTAAGTFNITVTAHNSVGDSTPVIFSLIVAAAGVIPTMTSTSPLPDGSVGTPYSFQFTATGTAPITFFGLVPSVGSPQMNLDGSTGILTWANPVAGVYTLQVEANNGAGSTGFINFSLTIVAIPVPPPPPPTPPSI